MKKRLLTVVTMACAAVALAADHSGLLAQTGSLTDPRLGAAQHEAEIAGNLQKAMAIYREIAADDRANRTTRAMALLHLGGCLQQLGDPQARSIYEQVLKDYADQPKQAALAMTLLSTLTSAAAKDRLICDDDCAEPAHFSASGRYLVAPEWRTGDLQLRDLSTGVVRRLMVQRGSARLGPNSSYAEEAVLSRDERIVAFTWWNEDRGSSELRVAPIDASAPPRTIVLNPEITYISPSAWSLDGRRVLAVVWRPDETSQIVWITVPDGTVQVLRSLEWRLDGQVSLSSDGRFVAYAASAVNPQRPPVQPSDRSERRIYILPSDGAGQEIEAVRTGGINDEPIWSADGTRLIFRSDRRTGHVDFWSVAIRDGKPAGQLTLLKMDVGRSSPVALTTGGRLYYVKRERPEEQVVVLPFGRDGMVAPGRPVQRFAGQQPAWSPDGKWLAYVIQPAFPNPSFETIVQAVDTGEERVFRREGLRGGPPLWLPDSKSFLQLGLPNPSSTLAASGGDRDWFQIDVASGTFRRVLEPSPEWALNGQAALSPDGTTLYLGGRPRADGTSLDRVIAADLSTGRYAVVFKLPLPADALPRVNQFQMRVSPDGKFLTMGLGDPKDGTFRLARVGVDGSDFRILASSLQVSGTIAIGGRWSQDGKFIYYKHIVDDRWRLVRIPSAGGTPTILFEAPSIRSFNLSPDESRLAYTTGEGNEAALWALDGVSAGR